MRADWQGELWLRTPRLFGDMPEMKHRFHVLGLAHTICTKEYSTCAFTQKVYKFCQMAMAAGHEVILYGHPRDTAPCTEHVSCTTDRVQRECYGKWNWRKQGFPAKQNPQDSAYKHFNVQAIGHIQARKRPGDFLLCFYGYAHAEIGRAFLDSMIVCEPGIGYAGGYFTVHKAFESYALLHAYLGLNNVMSASENMWYDVVIPNYFDPDDFTYTEKKDDYLAFLGRLGTGKGLHIASQLAEATGHRLVVAGHGADLPILHLPHVEYIGTAGPDQRRRLLAGAKAVVCASTFVEPFCGVQVEAMLSGTPVISSDFGAFTEVNIHGETGYRCRTFGDFRDSVRDIGLINPRDCYARGMDYSLANIWPLYEKFFQDAWNVRFGAGWYS